MMPPDKDVWLLIKRDLYERPNHQGYTGIRDEAGRYSFDDAVKHAKHHGLDHAVRLSEATEFRAAAFHDLVIAHLTKQRDSLASRVARLEMLTEQALDIIQHCDVTEGVCCCGDDMHKHAEPMCCGHAPVDHGSYVAMLWEKDACAALEANDNTATDAIAA